MEEGDSRLTSASLPWMVPFSKVWNTGGGHEFEASGFEVPGESLVRGLCSILVHPGEAQTVLYTG